MTTTRRGAVVRYGMTPNAMRSEDTSAMTAAAARGDNTALMGLADKFEELGHPAADVVRRAFSGDGIEGSDYHQSAVGLMHGSNPNGYSAPGYHPSLPHGWDSDGVGSASLHYYHLPTGHYWHLTLADGPHGEGKNPAVRSFLIPTTPEEVTRHADEIESQQGKTANELRTAVAMPPQDTGHYDYRLREAGIHPDQLPPVEAEYVPDAPHPDTINHNAPAGRPDRLSRRGAVLRYAPPQGRRPVWNGEQWVVPPEVPAGWDAVGVDTPGGAGEPEEYGAPHEHHAALGEALGGNGTAAYSPGTGQWTITWTNGDADPFTGEHHTTTHDSYEEALAAANSMHYSRRRSVMVRRYAAYQVRVPTVIRGTTYTAGEFVPDMEGDFMNPPTEPIRNECGGESGGGTEFTTTDPGKPTKTKRLFDPKKLAALKAKFGKPLVVSYSRRGLVTRYSATHEGLPAMLAAISPQAWRGWRGEGQPTHIDMTPRLVAADYLQDLGREQEAGILRDTTKHAYLHPHGVRDAAKIAQQYGAGDIYRAACAYPDLRQYIDTALWSSTDDDGNPLDNEHNVTHIHPNTLAAMVADAYHFSTAHQPTFDDTSSSESDRGHDFWLSRNGHGSGFFDKPEVYGEHGDTLQDAAEKHGEFGLHVDDGGTIHGDYEVPQDTGTEPHHLSRTSRYRVRYGAAENHKSFQDLINANPRDVNHRGVYADYLEENEPGVNQMLLHDLRHHKGDVWVHHDQRGVTGGPTTIPWSEVLRRNAPHEESERFEGRNYFHMMHDGNHVSHGQPHVGPGGTFFVTRTEHPDHEETMGYPYAVHELGYDGSFDAGVGFGRTPKEAHDFARQMAKTPPDAPPTPAPTPEPEPEPPPPPTLPVRTPPRPINLNDLMRPRRSSRVSRYRVRYGADRKMTPLHAKLHSLRGELADAAQGVYDSWDQSDEEHGDPELGFGGVCQDISCAIGDVLGKHGIDTTELSAQTGDQHVWTGAYDDDHFYHVDIHPHHYETGGGYNWKKIPGVKFTPDHISIEQGNRADHIDEDGNSFDYSRVSRYRVRYGADHATVDHLLTTLQQPEHNEHRWGLDDPVNGHRGITADALDDVGRSEEAELLRRPNTHVMVHGGRVVPAVFSNPNIMEVKHNYLSDGDLPGWGTFLRSITEFPEAMPREEPSPIPHSPQNRAGHGEVTGPEQMSRSRVRRHNLSRSP